MMQGSPSLDHWRAFDAAARHLSFKDAATELNVSPAAISQRIRTLEAQVETQLFHRATRAITLTDTGAKLASEIREGLAIIEVAIKKLERNKRRHVMTISTTTTFAERWLLPHLPMFKEVFSDWDVRIVTTDARVDFSIDDIDVAIRFGRGQYSGCDSTPIMKDLYVPVCAPGLNLSRNPQHISRHSLIHTDWPIESAAAPDWDSWSKQFGIPIGAKTRHLQFTVETLAVHAALAGQGIALVHEMHVRSELIEGTLIKPYGDEYNITPKFRYYLVTPLDRESENAKSFRDWLLAEFCNASLL